MMIALTIKLSNFNENHNVFLLFPQMKHLENVYDSTFHRETINTIQNEQDFQDDILASSKIGQNIPKKIDLHITDGKHNDA